MNPGSSKIFLDLQRHVDELFAELIDRRSFAPSQVEWRPPVDIHETSTEYLLDIDVPAVPPESVQIMVNDRQLTIKGARRLQVVTGAIYSQCERRWGEFRRCVDLPQMIDLAKAEAEYQYGSIRVRLPKRAETETSSVRRFAEVRVIVR